MRQEKAIALMEKEYSAKSFFRDIFPHQGQAKDLFSYDLRKYYELSR